MARFRKKPVVIEAVQFVKLGNDGEPHFKTSTRPWWVTEAFARYRQPGFIWIVGSELKVQTLEGAMTVSPGDWIIKGVKGELYPCKPDIFAATYDAEPDVVVETNTELESVNGRLA